MCREAVWAVLRRASSEPWFLREMFWDPRGALCSYDLTAVEAEALSSGNIAEIEACAGVVVSPFLRERFEEAMGYWQCCYICLARQEKDREEPTSQSLPELTADEAIQLVEEFLRDKGR